jgi:hypothetical protein
VVNRISRQTQRHEEAAPCPRYCGLVRMARWNRVAPQGCRAYQALNARVALIQALIPVGLQAVEDVLQQEVAALAGPRYARRDGAPEVVRWGRQRGSVYLADQKLPIQVPRVRNRQAGVEVPLQSYHRLQQPRAADEGRLRRILYGLSCRDYRAAAEAGPEAFGLSRSSVYRCYVPATARRLRALQGAWAGPVRPGSPGAGWQDVCRRHRSRRSRRTTHHAGAGGAGGVLFTEGCSRKPTNLRIPSTPVGLYFGPCGRCGPVGYTIFLLTTFHPADRQPSCMPL